MSILRPVPVGDLVRRMVVERARRDAIFDLPARSFYQGHADLDLSVRFHGETAATPLGPAAGPHTQLAQNIVLSYLAGGRILELKTVQVNDRLTIPRPCIDIQTIGYNVEWSQELLVRESLREYAKAIYCIAVLHALGVPGRAEARPYLLDVSVGYDLAGVTSAKMREFFRTLRDCGPLIEELRGELRQTLPASMRWLAEVPCKAHIGSCCTLSTFHGCPPGEIEAIGEFLLREMGLHTIVKMNPTLLGYEQVRAILHDRLGYTGLSIKKAAFDHDPTMDQSIELLSRLRRTAQQCGLTFGAKFTNTLVVEQSRGFLPPGEAYLSGQPLHVISLHLAALFRERMGAEFPISFSAGIDSRNVAAAVAAGMVPVTASSDLLRPGGYARMHRYTEALAGAMRTAGARTIDEYVRRVAGDGSDLATASLANHQRAACEALADPRYRAADNGKGPRKLGSRLELFDCINCDKCVPVCPQDANFTFETAAVQIEYRDLEVKGGALSPREALTLSLGGPKRATHQLANYADLCNDCGNCDVFCPEDGGPYIEKPRFFGSRASLDAAGGPGIHARREGADILVYARHAGHVLELALDASGAALFFDGFVELTFGPGEAAPRESRILVTPPDGHVVPVGLYHCLCSIARGVFAPDAISFVTAPLLEGEATCPASSAPQ